MPDEQPDRLSCTEAEFVEAFRLFGFLSPFMDEAAVQYAATHRNWFDHAEALNKEGIAACKRRENVVAGLSTHHPVAIATRMTFRALSALQGAIILYRRGMAAEGNTLSRSIYETAFWLGFIKQDSTAAIEAFVNDERKSQKGQAEYYLEQMEGGAIAYDETVANDLREMIARLRADLQGSPQFSIRSVAERSDLYPYYDAYKQLSASSAHTSLNSLHRFLKAGEPGSYDGHIIGPDLDSLKVSLPAVCVGIGVALALFCTIVSCDADEKVLNGLLMRTDFLRTAT